MITAGSRQRGLNPKSEIVGEAHSAPPLADRRVDRSARDSTIMKGVSAWPWIHDHGGSRTLGGRKSSAIMSSQGPGGVAGAAALVADCGWCPALPVVGGGG